MCFINILCKIEKIDTKLNDIIRSKGLVQGPGVQKTFRLSSHTPEQFNVMPRTV